MYIEARDNRFFSLNLENIEFTDISFNVTVRIYAWREIDGRVPLQSQREILVREAKIHGLPLDSSAVNKLSNLYNYLHKNIATDLPEIM